MIPEKYIWDNLRSVWIEVKVEYPEITTKTLKNLLLLPTSHHCEARFSAMTANKMGLWSRRDISNTFWVSVLPITPNQNHVVQENKFGITMSYIIVSAYITMS